jgi:hypothetical protein
MRRHGRGVAYVSRCAEDCVAGCQSHTEADDCLASLGTRREACPLELAPEKTRPRACGREARAQASRRGEKPQALTCLGMPCFWGTTRQGACKGKRQTSRKQLRQSRARFPDGLRRDRHLLPTGDLLRRAQVRGQGHLHSYAMTDNAERC